jgi:hypothetical protein
MRAVKIGAQLRVASHPGDGTTIMVVWRALVAQLSTQQA